MFSDAMDLEFMGHYFGKKKKRLLDLIMILA